MSPLSGLSISFRSRYILWNTSPCKGARRLMPPQGRLLFRCARWRTIANSHRLGGSWPPPLAHRNHEGDHTMKLSARNQLKGKIVDVVKGATTSHVRIDIGGGVIVPSSITNEAVADLALKKGDEAWAVIKASDVMIGK